jgi:hypothetical protein
LEESKNNEIKAYESERNSLQLKLKNEIEERKKELKSWYDEKMFTDSELKNKDKDYNMLKDENIKLKEKLKKKTKIIEMNKVDHINKIYQPDKVSKRQNKHNSYSPKKH